MKVVKLEEYRRAKRTKEISEEKESVWPARERLKEHLKEKLRQRLRERKRLQELEEEQSKLNILNLPKNYEGYSTQELLKMWEQLKNGGLPEDTQREKMMAMGKFLNEYKISPESRA